MLKATTKRTGATQSDIIRDALRMYLQKGNTKPLSFTQKAQYLCGSVIGPEDLSTNPKHLKGYGE